MKVAEALSLSTVESIVLLTLWFIILSCLGRFSKRPSHNILINRSIVHAIRLHVSEVLFSGVVSAHTIVCVCMYVCRARVPTVQFVRKHGTEDALK